VTEPRGAVLVDMRVTVTSVSTGIKSSAVSGAFGFYHFPALSVDTHSVPSTNRDSSLFSRAE
jgi:hypothetical protein